MLPSEEKTHPPPPPRHTMAWLHLQDIRDTCYMPIKHSAMATTRRNRPPPHDTAFNVRTPTFPDTTRNCIASPQATIENDAQLVVIQLHNCCVNHPQRTNGSQEPCVGSSASQIQCQRILQPYIVFHTTHAPTGVRKPFAHTCRRSCRGTAHTSKARTRTRAPLPRYCVQRPLSNLSRYDSQLHCKSMMHLHQAVLPTATKCRRQIRAFTARSNSPEGAPCLVPLDELAAYSKRRL